MVLRIGGLASGMDIDSIVEKLMTAEKAPLNKLVQSKQRFEWQRDAYRDVNKKLKAFDDMLFNKMTLQKDLMKKTVASTNSAVSATATTAAVGQSLTIDKVDLLATSGSAVANDNAKIPDGTLGSMKLSALSSPPVSNTLSLKVLQEDGTMKDVNIGIDANTTIDSFVSALKNNSGLNAFYDQASGQLAISTKATGVDSTGASIRVTSGADILQSLGFNSASDGAILAAGQNAKLNVSGATIERQSNTFELDGFKVTLNSATTQSSQITAKTDTDSVVKNIKDFVDTYNGLIESMNALYKEPKYRDFAPLTDDQKKDMDEKEIEAWEKKAKSGLLRGDSIIDSALSSMRTVLAGYGGGKQDDKAANVNFINRLSEMGITTSNKTADRGKLQVDEDKLRAAIESDPEQVFKTFSDTTKGNEGLVQKLRASIKNTTAAIEKKAGKDGDTNNTHNLGRSLKDVDNRIFNWKDRLDMIEKRYWKQFTAMEQAVNKANSTSSSLFASPTQ